MIAYQLKVIVRAEKREEFINYLKSISVIIQKEEGCLDFSVYKDLKMKDAYCIIAEWRTPQSMDKHFLGKLYPGLIGATKVLGSNFEMGIGETLEKGSYLLAKKKIKIQPQRKKEMVP